MTKTLCTWDHYGYLRTENVEGLSDLDIQKRAAAHYNYWWEKGGLENIPGAWDVVEDAEILKRYEMQDCSVAWHNGLDHCKCGHPECIHNQD